MFTVRCTQKLLDRMRAVPVPEDRLSGRWGDWFANVLIIRKQPIVLAVSGVALLPAILPAAPLPSGKERSSWRWQGFKTVRER